MQNEVTVRRLTADDLDVARTVRLAALQDSPTAFLSTYADTVKRTDQQWLDWLGAIAVYGAFLDGEPVGMAGGWRDPVNDPGVTELIAMWVSPQARGHRIAQRLADAIVGFAREAGDKAVHLEFIAGNDSAEAAYLRYGFAHIGPRKPDQRDRSMWLDL
ncbi:GNAT family N-acetyltransferase [Phytomonospora sp. NPDC050363]|uniref:GNAT family N-acetyltransferase n=1 Tax=Phytomonospora sp. NPDC050363 TaxID=3155642 RepID=UPI0033ECAB6A